MTWIKRTFNRWRRKGGIAGATTLENPTQDEIVTLAEDESSPDIPSITEEYDEKYEDFELEQFPGGDRLYIKYRGSYLYYWNSRKNWSLQDGAVGAVYVHNEDSAYDIMDGYLESIGKTSTFHKVEGEGFDKHCVIEECPSLGRFYPMYKGEYLFQWSTGKFERSGTYKDSNEYHSSMKQAKERLRIFMELNGKKPIKTKIKKRK